MHCLRRQQRAARDLRKGTASGRKEERLRALWQRFWDRFVSGDSNFRRISGHRVALVLRGKGLQRQGTVERRFGRLSNGRRHLWGRLCCPLRRHRRLPCLRLQCYETLRTTIGTTEPRKPLRGSGRGRRSLHCYETPRDLCKLCGGLQGL